MTHSTVPTKTRRMENCCCRACIETASRQTLVNWVVSAWKKLKECPAVISKSFEVSGITVNKDNVSIRNEEVPGEIATGLDANSADNDSEEESESEAEEGRRTLTMTLVTSLSEATAFNLTTPKFIPLL